MKGARGVWETHIAVRFWKGLNEGVEAVRVYFLCNTNLIPFLLPPPLPHFPMHITSVPEQKSDGDFNFTSGRVGTTCFYRESTVLTSEQRVAQQDKV